MNTILVSTYDSPAGRLIVGSIGNRLCLCDWATEQRRAMVDRRLCRAFDARIVEGTSTVTDEAVRQLGEYFSGGRRSFDLPLAFAGTDFQRRVWRALCDIPYGATISYATLAAHIGAPSAVRAVANANRANAISIFVPCHRVIGTDGSLTGYGGGLEAKRRLLSLEAPSLFSL